VLHFGLKQETRMKRDAYYALGGGIAIVLASASAAQPTPQPPPSPAVQPAPPTTAGTSGQATDQSAKPPVQEQKTCAPVLIRAGPNQGQVINKCHHTDRSKTDSQSPG
jgi:hypothetical protein